MALQGRRIDKRVARERARNTRLALVGILGFAVLISAGLRTSWTPSRIPERLTPAELERQKFAESRAGRIRLETIDTGICREMQFDNTTGQFSNGRLVRCDADAAAAVEGSPDDPRERATSIRNGFSRR